MRATKAALAAAGVIGALTVGASIPAFAQDATPDLTNVEERRAEAQSDFAKRLADELDVDQAKVEDALEKVREAMRAEAETAHQAALKERLDAAVEDGQLTREQADAILEAQENGVLLGGGHGRGGRHMGGPGFGLGFGRGPLDREDATPAPSESAEFEEEDASASALAGGVTTLT